MTKKFNKGFTLIELLVVIAIIGILASVVLASLNSARDKGSDAAIKANLANTRAQAELYYDDNGSSYGSDTSSCTASSTVFTDATVANAIAAAEAASGGSATCSIASDAWAISVPLKSSGTWCVDSAGQSSSSTAVSGACS